MLLNFSAHFSFLLLKLFGVKQLHGCHLPNNKARVDIHTVPRIFRPLVSFYLGPPCLGDSLSVAISDDFRGKI